MLDPTLSLLRVAYAAVLFAGIVVLVWATVRRRDQSGAFTRGRSLGSDVAAQDAGAVPDAAIATNLQLVSIYPNIQFGFGGLAVAPLLNVLGFLLGNGLMYLFMDPFMRAVAKYGSPHRLAAGAHGIPSMRKWTSLVSLAVFAAVTCFEIAFLARISRLLLGGTDGAYLVLVAL